MKHTIIAGSIFAALPSIRFAADKGDNATTGSGTATAEGGTPPTPEPFVLPVTPPVAETSEIELKKIVIDAGTQPRVAIDDEVVKEYAEVIKACIKNEQPIPFPPVTIFRDATGRCVLADGFHRFAAHKMAHAKEIAVEIRDGDERAALLFSLSANQTHGVRRTNKDKQRAVKIAVNDEQLRTLGNSEIARLCGVSEFMVREMRPAAKTPTTRTVTIRGKKTTMKTGAIGKGKGGGAKGAKGKGKGKAEAAAPKGNKKEEDAKELDRLLLKIVDAVGAPEGGKFRAAVHDGSLELSLRDIRDMASIAPAKQKAILPLITGGPRMKPAKAFEFVCSELPEKMQTELFNRAIGSDGGKYVFEGEGFKVTVEITGKASGKK